jgi:hypothetical protein
MIDIVVSAIMHFFHGFSCWLAVREHERGEGRLVRNPKNVGNFSRAGLDEVALVSGQIVLQNVVRIDHGRQGNRVIALLALVHGVIDKKNVGAGVFCRCRRGLFGCVSQLFELGHGIYCWLLLLLAGWIFLRNAAWIIVASTLARASHPRSENANHPPK